METLNVENKSSNGAGHTNSISGEYRHSDGDGATDAALLTLVASHCPGLTTFNQPGPGNLLDWHPR